MSDLTEELVRKARALPPEDRARLAEELHASLHEDDGSDIEAAWDQEIRRRIAEIESGTAKLLPAEGVLAEIRQMLK